MTVTSKMQDAAEMDENVAMAKTTAVAPRIERCGSKPSSQLLLKCDGPAVLAVDVTGQPEPDVHWHVAGRRVRKSTRYRASASGHRHTLTVLRVTDELEKGVWVMASNSAGEDSCLITVKTYKGGAKTVCNRKPCFCEDLTCHNIQVQYSGVYCCGKTLRDGKMMTTTTMMMTIMPAALC